MLKISNKPSGLVAEAVGLGPGVDVVRAGAVALGSEVGTFRAGAGALGPEVGTVRVGAADLGPEVGTVLGGAALDLVWAGAAGGTVDGGGEVTISGLLGPSV